MEKFKHNITEPSIVHLKINASGASLSISSENYNDEISISCDDTQTVKYTINYDPGEVTPKTIEDLHSIDDNYYYGGTDNWGDFSGINIEELIQFCKDGINIWEDTKETNQTVQRYNKDNAKTFTDETGKTESYVTKQYQEPLVIGYNYNSNVGDSVYVNSITDKDDNPFDELFAGENNWCKCTYNGNLIYTALTTNPTNEPRIAYFTFKTNDELLTCGPNVNCYVLPDWVVTVIQKPNPNAAEKEIKLEDVEGNDHILGEHLYSVGLISDMHFDINDFNSRYSADLSNALSYFLKNKVDFISCLGDICEYNNYDISKFNEYYNKYAYDSSINSCLRLFTCLGNTDYMKFYNNLQNNELYNSIMHFTRFYSKSETNEYNIKYFEYDGEWDKQYVGTRTNKSKTNYYVTYNDDIYVYLSVDYGDSNNITDNQLLRACNKVDYNDKYVKQLISIATEAGYDYNTDGKFDYQFYNSNTLIWLKDIIENNLDKHIFVFMHHGLPHKSGNSASYWKTYYSKRKIYPYDNRRTILKDIENSGSYMLCGLQFYFINWLNNKYKNVIWFSGHTHYGWECGESKCINQFIGDQYLNFCNKDFNVYKPTGNEYYETPTKPSILSKDYRENIYTRIPLALGNSIYADNPIGTSAWNIHLPSLSKPLIKTEIMNKSSEGGLMDVYQHGIVIKELLFKDENIPNYINYIINYKVIKFEQ